MDEVWIISLCLTLFAFFIFILSMKSKSKPEPESIVKAKASSASSAYTSYSGNQLECSEEEVEKMMEKLTSLLYNPGKKEVYEEKRKSVPQERAEEGSQRRRKDEDRNETQESSGKGPGHTQPACQLTRPRVQERSAPAAGVENIMDEIEQAVQETVEPDYYTRRRQHQAASRGKQWSELSGGADTDSI
ncbi:uncharacterized protein WCC33_013787 [Rhinophrynus dorsalis]